MFENKAFKVPETANTCTEAATPATTVTEATDERT
jgi:hypothetical protein